MSCIRDLPELAFQCKDYPRRGFCIVLHVWGHVCLQSVLPNERICKNSEADFATALCIALQYKPATQLHREGSLTCHDLLQGVRRVVAVTSAEAEAAVARAEALTKAMEAAQKLTGPALEAEIAILRQVWPCTLSGSLPHMRRCISEPTSVYSFNPLKIG